MSTEHPSSSNNNMCESERRSTDRWRFDRSCAHVLSCSLCGRRVCRVARWRCYSPSPCVHAHIHVSECGGSSAGALTHRSRDRTRGVVSIPEAQGRGPSRDETLIALVGTRVRRPGTAINVLNSHSPGSGGTVPLPQTLLAPQFAQPLYSPSGAVTHGLYPS